MKNTIINLPLELKERFDRMKKEYSENPEGRDSEFLEEMMDFAEEESQNE